MSKNAGVRPRCLNRYAALPADELHPAATEKFGGDPAGANRLGPDLDLPE
jgi:hypothetical protein